MITLNETTATLEAVGDLKEGWFLELTCSEQAVLPFREITNDRLLCQFKQTSYSVSALKGTFKKTPDSNFQIRPDQGKLVLDFSHRPTEKD